jgi:hypothetical protein
MFNHVGCKLVQVGTKRIEPKLLELSQQGPLIWKPLMDVVGCSVFTSAGCIKGFIHILRKVIFPDDSKVVVTHRLPLFISFLKGAYKQAPGGLTPDWTLSKTKGGVITEKVASLYAQACKTSVVHQPTPSWYNQHVKNTKAKPRLDSEYTALLLQQAPTRSDTIPMKVSGNASRSGKLSGNAYPRSTKVSHSALYFQAKELIKANHMKKKRSEEGGSSRKHELDTDRGTPQLTRPCCVPVG